MNPVKRRPSFLTAVFGAVASILGGDAPASAAPEVTFNISSGGGVNFSKNGLSYSKSGRVRYVANLNTPPKNQRQRRKARRRAWAAGDKFAFSPKN